MSDHQFHVNTSGFPVRLGLNVQIGQVFRWQVDPISRTAWGVDGEAAFHITPTREGWDVMSNHDETYLRNLFRLDEDYAELISRAITLEPSLDAVFERTSGLVLMRPSDPVETLFSFLCSSNNHISRISAMVRWLGAQGSVMWAHSGHELTRFPTVDHLAAIPEDAYRAAGFGYRGATLPVAAAQIRDRGGLEWLRSLKQLEYTEARARLMELAGVGPKLADCICLFGLHQDLAVPIDIHMWRAACLHEFPEWVNSPLTEHKRAAVQVHFGKKYGDLSGLVHQAMFVNQLWKGRSQVIDW